MIAFFHSCVCFVAFVAANVGAVKKINGFHDPRVKFPSLTTMMTPDSDVATLLKPQKLSGASTAASSQPSGLTYLEFYSEPNCAGSITYSSGYRSNLCLPANDYVRPPFADNDDFYYKFPFQTLRISNLTGKYCRKKFYLRPATCYYRYRAFW